MTLLSVREVVAGYGAHDEVLKQVGLEVEEDLLKLVKLRNKGARSLGFGNYYSMALKLDELDEKELFALFDELEQIGRAHV